MGAVDIDLELARWVLDYVREKGEASEAGVVREFFPDEPDTARAYLDFLKNGRAIRRQGQSWFPVREGAEPPKDQPEREPSEKVSHKDCLHPKTKYERQKCRYGYYKPGTMEPAPTVGQILKAMKPKPAPKPKRVPKAAPEPKPQLTPEEAKANRKRWNGGSGLTTPKLSHFIYKRMRANRHRQYVFDREWLYRQYPGVRPEMVDEALQRLVDKGRISGLPK